MKKTLRQSKLVEKLITEPHTVISKLNLIYINDDELRIIRQKNKKGFIYILNNKPLSTKKDIKRIKSLVIPPAWNNVRIASLTNGHLQAVGRDVKNRKQYRYHPLWNKIRNQTKFYKMTTFGKKLPGIRAKIDNDLDSIGWSKGKIIALIIRLMEETHIRIGNEQYAKRNKTYGLSTMRNRHVKLEKDTLRFEFVGKKGKRHNVSLHDKKLIRLVNKCEEIPGWELFQYYDEKGMKQRVESGMINQYIHEICGDLFTAKDFRTWAATIIFFETVMELGIAEGEEEIKKNILAGYDAAAGELGNTRNVCRKYYVHPHIVELYQNGDIRNFFDKVDKVQEENPYFTPSEKVVLEILESYTPVFLT